MGRRRTGQLALAIDTRRRPTGRGGWRPNAGRKSSGRMSHGRRAEFRAHHPLHVTLRVRPEAAGLRRRKVFTVVRRAIAESERDGFRVCQFNVLSNHLHLVCEAAGAQALSNGVQRLATRIALRVNRCLGRRGKVFAERYHARAMTTPREVRNGLVYVLQNQKHHDAGNRRLSFDPFSSAASFDGWAQPLPRDAGWMREALAAPAATAPPTTWLLARGWRRHGLVGLDEAPGRPASAPGRAASRASRAAKM